MNEEFTRNIENDEFTLKNKETDYENLMTRLKSLSTNIALLEKQYLNKF